MAWSFDCSSIDASGKRSNENIVDPPGFMLDASKLGGKDVAHGGIDADEIAKLKVKKAWDAAIAPAKSIPMNAFMLYMSGNSIQIFSILVTVMLLFNSVKAAMGVSQVFERFQTVSSAKAPTGVAAILAMMSNPLLLPMIAFVVIQAANLALGIWKCGAMGLLPTATSDWLAFLDHKKIAELSAGGWF
ncbi:hypothetical protein BC831DRAFT_465378 [Entophlyctis helioformis]|nr:hypothetical protein BC831DRAFT_465378 [Entophlyctis helioformis]